MHDIVEREFEDHLVGMASREFTAHLAVCGECREEVEGMTQVSSLLGSLRSDAPMDPTLGFSSRVLRNVAERKNRSVWGLFAVDPAFTRRLALASLLGLAVFSGYLATQDDGAVPARHTPEAVMASHDPSLPPDNPDHMNGMLMTLATYHQ
jgi:hypothetical protein